MNMREIINIFEAVIPTLRPAIRFGRKIYIGRINDSHYNVFRDMPQDVQNAFDESAESYEKSRGFVDQRGRYMTGHQAFRYAEKHDLIDQDKAKGLPALDFLTSEFLRKM